MKEHEADNMEAHSRKDAKDKDYRVGLDGTDDDENYVPALSDAASILSSESKRSSGPLSKSTTM